MKKLLTTVAAFLFFLSPSLALADGAFLNYINTFYYDYTSGDNLPAGTYSFTCSSGTPNGFSSVNGSPPYEWLSSLGTASLISGNLYLLTSNGSYSNGNAVNFSSDGSFVNCGAGPLSLTPYSPPTPPTPPATGLPGEIAAAEQGMASTTGFNVSGVVVWSGDNLIKLFIGSGLGLLYGLRLWIVAVLIISAIVFFSFRAFRFFRH